MITQKRPFSINQELERNNMTKLVVKLGRENSVVEEKEYCDNGEMNCIWSIYKKVHFKCPCCDLLHDWSRLGRYKYNEKGFEKFNMDEFHYETAYVFIIEHFKKMVRMHGEKKHMQFIINFFGKEKGLMILEHFARRNILVAKMISEFIKSAKEDNNDRNRYRML